MDDTLGTGGYVEEATWVMSIDLSPFQQPEVHHIIYTQSLNSESIDIWDRNLGNED